MTTYSDLVYRGDICMTTFCAGFMTKDNTLNLEIHIVEVDLFAS